MSALRHTAEPVRPTIGASPGRAALAALVLVSAGLAACAASGPSVSDTERRLVQAAYAENRHVNAVRDLEAERDEVASAKRYFDGADARRAWVGSACTVPELRRSDAPNSCVDRRSARLWGYEQCRPDHGCGLIVEAVASSEDTGFVNDFLANSACSIGVGADYIPEMQAAKSALGESCKGEGLLALLACGGKAFLDVSDHAIANTCAAEKATACMADHRAWASSGQSAKRTCDEQLANAGGGAADVAQLGTRLQAITSALETERAALASSGAEVARLRQRLEGASR